MRIEGSEFGNITIDGKTYEHDVIIRLSGKVKKRQKKLSKRQYGTSHIISRAEAKFVFEKGCGVIIVGAGHEGNVRLSPEASEAVYFDVTGHSTPDSRPVGSINRARCPAEVHFRSACIRADRIER